MLPLLVFLTVCTLTALWHLATWRGAVRDARLPSGLRGFSVLLFAIGATILPVTGLTIFAFGREEIGSLFFAPIFWLVPFSYFALVVTAGQLLRRALRKRSSETAPPSDMDPESTRDSIENPGRRVFFARSLGSAGLVTSTGASVFGVRSAIGEARTPEIEVALDRYSRKFDGFRIALLSDIHVGPLLGEEALERIVARTNAAKPDLIAITGDLVDAPLQKIARSLRPLAALNARFGVFFVTGNHEYYHGEIGSLLSHLRTLGVQILENSTVQVVAGNAIGFDLMGVNDFSRRKRTWAPDWKAALRNHDADRAVVLLAHQPRHVDEAALHGVSLQLAGHTHGGQLFPIGTLAAKLWNPYTEGLHTHTKETQIFVSRGAGYWGIPMRLFAPPEIPILILKSR